MWASGRVRDKEVPMRVLNTLWVKLEFSFPHKPDRLLSSLLPPPSPNPCPLHLQRSLSVVVFQRALPSVFPISIHGKCIFLWSDLSPPPFFLNTSHSILQQILLLPPSKHVWNPSTSHPTATTFVMSCLDDCNSVFFFYAHLLQCIINIEAK